MPNLGPLPRPDSLAALEHSDSMDSGMAAAAHLLPSSPMYAFGRPGSPTKGHGDRQQGPVVSVGEDDRLTGHTASVMCLTVANGLLFSGGTDATIKVRRTCSSLPSSSAGSVAHGSTEWHPSAQGAARGAFHPI